MHLEKMVQDKKLCLVAPRGVKDKSKCEGKSIVAHVFIF